MFKQNILAQSRVQVRRGLALSFLLALGVVFLIRPPAAQAVFIAALVGNTATLTGDNTAETIIITVESGNLKHNRFSAGDLGFNSDLDWDSVQLGDQTLPNAANVTIIINAGLGNDEIIVGTPASPASSLVAALDLRGQNGTNDKLTLDNSTDATGRTIAVRNNAITGLGGSISYATIETITITTGSGSDTINVGSAGNSLDGINTVSLNTGGAADTLNLNDQGDPTANTYTLSSASVQRAGGTVINYLAVESLTLNAGTNDDTITVQNSLASTPIQINSGDSSDTLNIGNGSNTLDNLQSLLTINGGTNGSDTVKIEDSTETDVNTYTITPNTVQRGTAVISYTAAVGNLLVNAGVSTDTLIITGTASLTLPTVYTITTNTIQYSGAATVTHNALENVFVNGGPANDTFNIQGSLIPTTLSGNGDGDTFVFADGATLSGGTIDGGVGPDKLDYTAYTTSVTLSPNTATGTGGISSIRDMTGGEGNDTLIGTSNNNIINGGPGNDSLTGGPVNNNTGSDTLIGGPGDDLYEFVNGWGLDSITEEADGGSDSMNFAVVTAPLTITISSVIVTDGVSTATHIGREIENVVSGSGNDIFNVTASALISQSLSLDGGPHSTADRLNFDANGLAVILTTNTITATSRQPLFHTRIEQINIFNDQNSGNDEEDVFLPAVGKGF